MNIFIVASRFTEEPLYIPHRAFLSKEKATEWIKIQGSKAFSHISILPFDVPNSWYKKIFSGKKIPAIYVALWEHSSGTTFFPDSIACSRDEVNQYIELLPSAIKNYTDSLGLVVIN